MRTVRAFTANECTTGAGAAHPGCEQTSSLPFGNDPRGPIDLRRAGGVLRSRGTAVALGRAARGHGEPKEDELSGEGPRPSAPRESTRIDGSYRTVADGPFAARLVPSD